MLESRSLCSLKGSQFRTGKQLKHYSLLLDPIIKAHVSHITKTAVPVI